MKTNKINKVLVCIFILTLASCKNDFLEVKPNKALLVPTSLSDFDALLDNNGIMNRGNFLAIVGSDDLSVTDAAFNSASFTLKNTYSWNETIYEGEQPNEWLFPYYKVFYSNIVLDGLGKVNETESIAYKNVKGSALFFRAFAFFELITSFTTTYQKSTAVKELGIPLKLSSDVNEKYTRGNLQKAYDQVIGDLKLATSLLPVVSTNCYRPNRAAAHALLSKIYLSMSDYESALQEADNSLKINGKLLDYNTMLLNLTSSTVPFPKILPVNLNPEVLFNAGIPATLLNAATTTVNPEIVNSYAINDLRKAAFLYDRGAGVIGFKGRYSSSTISFTGLTIDEVLLTRAECYARLNKPTEALVDLNLLLVNRFKTGTYQPYTINNTSDILRLILTERRKELLFRGTRWMDLKRLNLDTEYAVTLTRFLNGITYTLLPNSKRYVLPIPDDEIIISGIEQNLR